ncbi:MAG: right-handed parallel beta-helix repeat-containing protein [Paludibacteraceae bacterium]|nr:right-handed parallel beta-helix repeat-containing protein [Paludibacteraceae bacterium]
MANEQKGSWTILFKTEGVVEMKNGLVVSGLDELIIEGNSKVTVRFNCDESVNITNPPITFENIKNLSFEGVDFELYSDSELRIEDQYRYIRVQTTNSNVSNINLIKDCSFDGIGILAKDNVSVETIQGGKFSNCYSAIDVDIVNTINDVEFYNNWYSIINSDKNNIRVIGKVRVKEIVGCKFVSNKELNCKDGGLENPCTNVIVADVELVSLCEFYGNWSRLKSITCSVDGTGMSAFLITKCKKLINCYFDDWRYPFSKSEFSLIENCDFKNITYCFNESSCIELKDCDFLDNGAEGLNNIKYKDWIQIIDNCTNLPKIYLQSPIKKIVKSTFLKSWVSGPLEGAEITNNTFNESYLVNESETAGLYSENLFIGDENGKVIKNKNDDAPKPIIKSIVLGEDKLIIKGSCGPNAKVELFQNEGFNQTATKYLKSINADKDGYFEAEVNSPVMLKGKHCFSATATYNKTQTSELSDTYCFSLPENVYVKENGEGDGSSWDDAMSPEFFVAALSCCPSGTVFYVAEGDYQLSTTAGSCSIHNNVTILGGFSDNSSGTESVSDVVNNITRFSNCNIDLEDVSASFSGIEFSGVSIKGNESTPINTVSFDSCSFVKSLDKYRGCRIDIPEASTASILNCRFENNYVWCRTYYDIFAINAKTITIRNCSFIGLSDGGCTDSRGLRLKYDNCTIENSTFSDLELLELINAKGNYMKFNNNTCVGFHVKGRMSAGTEYGSPIISNGEMIGNIIECTSEVTGGIQGVKMYNNVFIPRDDSYQYTKLVTGDNANIYIKEDELAKLINGKLSDPLKIYENIYDYDVYSFTPEIDRSGFLPVIRLNTDKLSDDTGIRFDRIKTGLTVDATGENRLNSTCPGALELTQVYREIKDTVCQGEIYNRHGFNYNTEGLKNTQYLTGVAKGETGVDTLFNVALVIAPWRCDLDLTGIDFYVKEDGTGKGTSWKDAMSPDDFRYAIPRVKEGATFHIAAGEYSIYNPMESSSDEAKYMYVNAGIKFIGGYPADAEDQTAVSDPTENVTYLQSGSRYHSQYPIFVITESAKKSVEFQNVVLYKATVRNTSADLESLIFDGCKFYYSTSSDYASVYCTEKSNAVVSVKNSLFFGDRRDYNAIKVLNGKTVEIENTDFSWYAPKGALFDIDGADFVLKNSVFTDISCQSLLSCSNQNNQSFYNNTFVKNDYTSFISEKSASAAKGTRKFIGNIIERGSDDMSSFVKNATCHYNVTDFTMEGSDNIKVSAFDGLLDGSTSLADGKFRPNTIKNGIHEYIVKLKGDEIEEKSIRFPLDETVVSSDILGQKRNKKTCAGACEFPKEEVFHLESITFGEDPECVVKDRVARIEVADGVSPYTFEIQTTDGKQVQQYMNASPIQYMVELPDGEYVAVITDGQNKVVTSEPFTITSKRKFSATVTKICDGSMSHIVLDYAGAVKKVELQQFAGYYDVTSLYDADSKSVTAKNSYLGVRLTFSDGCQSYASLDEVKEEPLAIAFATTPKIENQTCEGEDNGSFTCYPASQINLRGYKMCLVVTNKTTKEVYKDCVTQSGSRMSVKNLPVGEYEAYIALGYDDCIVDDSKKVLDDFTIKALGELEITDISEETAIRCEGTTISQKFEVRNYDANLYTWNLTKDDKDITAKVEATVPTTSNGTFVFDELSAGKYVFSLVDQCEKAYTKKFTIKESIKQAIDFSSENSHGVSCEGKSDGLVNIKVINWSYGDKGVLTNTTTGQEVENAEFTKSGSTSFSASNVSGGKYLLSVTDLCGRESEYEVDIDELNKTSKFDLSLDAAEDAGCNEESRKIAVSVSGTASEPYSYTLYKVEGTEETLLDSKEEVTDETYTSGKLDYGKYKLTAVNKNGCEVSVERTFSASHALSGTRLVCGTNTHVELNYDGVIEGVSVKVGGKWIDVKFDEDANKSVFDYNGVVTDVRVKESGCVTDATLTDVDLSGDLFAGVEADYSVSHETCYGKKDGSISVTYSGYKGNMEVVAYAGEKKSTYDAESKSLIISGLAPGSYDVKLGFVIDGCDVEDQSKSVETGVEIKSVGKPELTDNKEDLTIRCEGKTVTETINITNYDKNLYTWKLTKDGEEITAKPVITTGEKAAFKFSELSAGAYEFSLVDKCEKVYSFKFTVSESLKPALTFDEAHKGVSCDGKADGVVSFSVSNWDNDNDKAVFKNLTTDKAVECTPVYEDGTITYSVSGVSTGKYSLSVTEFCGTKYDDQIVDIDELNKTTKFDISLGTAEDAGCNEESRKISATVSGLETQAPYTYVLYKVEGEEETVIDDKQKEVTDRTYTSGKLDFGKYKLVAVNNDGCEVSVERTFSASHALSGTRLVCGTNTHVELNYDGVVEGVSVKVGGKWIDVKFDEDANKSVFDYNGVVTDVRVKESGCVTDATLTDVDLSGDLFAGVEADYSVSHETCYGKKDGSISVTYSGYKGNMEVVAYAGEKKSTYDAESKSLIISGLVPGSYDVKLGFVIDGCDVEDQSKSVGTGVEIKSVGKPELADNKEDLTIRCEGKTVTETINITNYDKNLYTWKLTKDGEEITAKPVITTGEKAAFKFSELSAGAYEFSLVDKCEKVYSFKFTVSESLKPALTFDEAHKGVSCDGKADGVVSFSVSNWDNDNDKAVFKNLTTDKAVECTPVYEDGTITYSVSGVSTGKYSLSVTEFCGTKYDDQIVDIDELNKTTKFDISLGTAEDAGCNEESRKISATVSGLETQAPYTYVLYKVEGEEETVIDDKQKDVTDRTYTSGKLDFGKYKLVAVNKNGCEVSVERTFSASHALSGTRLVCGTNTHVELNYDGVVEGVSVKVGGKWIDVKFDEDANKSVFDYNGVVTDVRVKESGCVTDATLTDVDLSGDLFAGVEADYSVSHETCYGKKDGSISVTYSGYKGNMEVVAYAGEKKSTYDAESKSLIISGLAPGSYDVKLAFVIDGCEVEDQSKSVGTGVEIKSVGKPELADNKEDLTIRCEGKTVTETINITNYDKNLYTWKLTKDGEEITAKPVITTGEKAAFKFSELSAGAYEFSLVDKCEKVYSFKFTVSESLKPALTFDEAHKGVSCDGKADGVVSFSVSNWDNDNDKAVFKNLTTDKAVECTPVYEDGTITYSVSGVSTGKYSLSVTEFCGTKYDDQIVDIDELNKTTKFDISLGTAEDAGCNEESRKISATVSGLETQAPYTYVLYKVEGEEETVIDDKQKEVTDRTYTSGKLDFGKYKLVAVNNDGCEVSVERTFSASHALSGTRLVCGTNTHVELNYDGVVEGVSVKVGGKWIDVKFDEDANKSIFDYNGVVTDVRVKESGCATDATLTDVDLSGDLFAGVSSSYQMDHQKCFGTDDCSIAVKYTGFTGNMNVTAYAIDAKGNEVSSIYDDEQKCLLISKLAPGIYDVELRISVNGCSLSDKAYNVAEKIELEGLEEPVYLSEKYSFVNNRCEGKAKGSMHMEMKGWKDGYYYWTIKRAGSPDGEIQKNWHHGDALADGVFAFDIDGLPEGKNTFTMYDYCGNVVFAQIQNISADYIDAITLDMGEMKPYTCADRKDGSLSFIASPWVAGDEAVIKLGEEKLSVSPEVKEGKAYFNLSNQGAGVYTITTTDLCSRKEEKAFDFTEFAEKNGLFHISSVDYDAKTARCEWEKRFVKACVAGGTAPYVYKVETIDGNSIQVSEPATSTSFVSDLLPDGKFKIVAVDNTNCESVYDEGLEQESATKLVAQKREVICGDQKYTLVTAKHNGVNNEREYWFMDANKDNVTKVVIGGEIDSAVIITPVDVTFTQVSSYYSDCDMYARLTELPLDNTALTEADATVTKVYKQRCFGKDNGGVVVDYDGPKTVYSVAIKLVDKKDATHFYYSGIAKSTKETLSIEDAAPGEYELFLVHKLGECELEGMTRKLQDVTVAALTEPLALYADKTKVYPSDCYSVMNARSVVAATGWTDEVYTLRFYDYNENGELHKRGDDMGANHVTDVTDKEVYAWSTGPNLTAGKYYVTWGDMCDAEIIKYQFTVDPLKQPSIKMLESSYVDLKCNYDKAYVDFSYEGGSPVNKRLLFKYVPNDDWEYTTEPLAEANTYRLYGFTLGSGNQGHKKVEGTDYELTDDDAGLIDGTYRIIYEDETGKCPGDDVSFDVTVKRQKAIKFLLDKQDVKCFDMNMGTVCFVPYRNGGDLQYTKTLHPDRAQGRNWAYAIISTDEEQKAFYSSKYKIDNSENGDHNILGETVFRSKVFSDIANIHLVAKEHEENDIKTIIKDTLDKNGTLPYPLSKLYNNGNRESVATDWIGLDMLPADEYTIVVTDTFNCTYTKDFSLVPPRGKRLEVYDTEYLGDADGANPVCNAEERRIRFKCTGGNYPYLYSIVNLDLENKNLDLDEMEGEGGIGSSDYVQDVTIKKIQEGSDNQIIDYTSEMLSAGTYEVRVYDYLGCVAKGGTVKVEAKFELNGTPHVDLCNPSDNNILLLNKDFAKTIDHFTYMIGHGTHCKSYPYCSVDDGDVDVDPYGYMQHTHQCNYEDFADCKNKTVINGIERRYNQPVESNLSYREKVDEQWVDYTNAVGVTNVPKGRIGFIAYDKEGCSAFAEFDFKSTGLPMSLAAVSTEPVNCYGDEEGTVELKLYGGHEFYTKVLLDGEELPATTPIVMTTVKKNDPVLDEYNNEVVTRDTITLSYLLNNEKVFNDLKLAFDAEQLMKNVKKELTDLLGVEPTFAQLNEEMGKRLRIYEKTSYSFTLGDLKATMNFEGADEKHNHKHVITVVDNQNCEFSTEFDIYQPTKLKIEAEGSYICHDKSTRIFAKSTTGGVSPYLYKVEELSSEDYIFDERSEKYPQTPDGEDLTTYDDYKRFYMDEYHTNDHIPVGDGAHVMLVQDANGCEAASDITYPNGDLEWKSVKQDQLISTWHDFGNVLVVEDQTDYSVMNSPIAQYDSMKVMVVMDDETDAEKFEGVMVSNDLYVYGIQGSSLSPKWTSNSYQGPSWGIPLEAQKDYMNLSEEMQSRYKISDGFDKLVADDESLRRMVFVQFRNPETLKDFDLQKFLDDKNKDNDGKGVQLGFTIRVIAYVAGCDVITEHNSLALNLDGVNPYPNPKFMNSIHLAATKAKDGETTLFITMADPSSFKYIVYGVNGAVKSNVKSYKLTSNLEGWYVTDRDGNLYSTTPAIEANDDSGDSNDTNDTNDTIDDNETSIVVNGKEEVVNYYTYALKVSDITENVIIKVFTESNAAAIKVLNDAE